ncbi:SAM-dependent methyltransferase [Pararhodonellum marinum]|uniref:SAM-dependent methyltransferase n=1 Tax=Pararhodonellum marinum TaxID=2755358 RepID=UPI00188F9FC2|nr:methyltransferase domain-containing protein [Pararhodonellum marinum]
MGIGFMRLKVKVNKKVIFWLFVGLVVLPMTCGLCQDKGSDFSDLVPYVTTPPAVIQEILQLAEVTSEDVLYDLGSGDGRIPIAAARQFGIRALGVEIDAELVNEANENAQIAGVSDLVTFVQGDLFAMDLSEATVLVLYLFPDINLKLRPRILQLEPGTRVISHRFDMGDWEPEETRKIVMEDGAEHVIFLWRVTGEEDF